jgi:predicted transcriptional regulator
MMLTEIAAALGCEILTPCEDGVDITTVVASDGMSEILAYHRPDALMLTGLTNIQSVRTAVVADVYAIVYVRGKRPPAKVLELASEKGIPVLSTRLGMFESCGILYKAGLEGAM